MKRTQANNMASLTMKVFIDIGNEKKWVSCEENELQECFSYTTNFPVKSQVIIRKVIFLAQICESIEVAIKTDELRYVKNFDV